MKVLHISFLLCFALLLGACSQDKSQPTAEIETQQTQTEAVRLTTTSVVETQTPQEEELNELKGLGTAGNEGL